MPIRYAKLTSAIKPPDISSLYYKSPSIGAPHTKQLTAYSNTKVEYVAMATAASELVWLSLLFHNLHYSETLKTPTLLYCNNQYALAIVDTTHSHSHTKHISTCYHLICKLMAQNKVVFHYCPTYTMYTYILTKSLSRPKLAQHLPMLDLLGGETPCS